MELALKLEDYETVQNAPGPRGIELYTMGYLFQKRPLYVWNLMKESFGDVIYAPWKNRNSLFLFHPNDVRYVLKDNHTNYRKSKEYQQMEPLLGEGLLTSEGELWRRQRRIMAKEFHSSKIDQFLVSIHQSTQTKIAQLSEVKAPLDITTEFNALTFEIAGSLFFGSKLEGQSHIAQSSLYTETERVNARIRRLWNFPFSFPTGENIRGNKAVKNLRGIVSGILNNANHEEKSNVLSKLVSYKDENGQRLPTKLISDEVMTLMLAGHETTSNGLSWASFLLAEHPQWIMKLREELKEYGKTPEELTKEDLTKLPLLDAVWKESLRLYPPIPILSRQTLEEDVIGGFKVPAGVSVQCCPYITHRDERFWNQPNTFMPERFVDRVISRDDCTYFPFAKGPRACIGEELANVEGLLILSYMTHYFDWGLKKGFKPQPHHHLTLRSENGMWLNLKKSFR
jgi:cytochrome P450